MNAEIHRRQVEKEEQYTLYMPFTISDNFEFKLEDGILNLPELHLTLKLNEEDAKWKEYSIAISGFKNSKEATSYFKKLQGMLYWIALENKLGISMPEGISELNIFKQPIPLDPTNPIAAMYLEEGWLALDGVFDGRKAAVYSDTQRLMVTIGGRASVTIGISQQNIQKYINEANTLESLENICRNKNLKLAIELYFSNQFESTSSVKLIQYITILEVLCKIDSDENIKKIQRFKKLVKCEMSKGVVLQETKDPLSAVEEAYKLRNSLVHGDAKAEDFSKKQKEALIFLDEFIKLVLQRRFKEEVTGAGLVHPKTHNLKSTTSHNHT